MLIDRHGQAARALNFESGNGSHGNANGGGNGVGGSRDGDGGSCDPGRDHELRDTYRGMVQWLVNTDEIHEACAKGTLDELPLAFCLDRLASILMDNPFEYRVRRPAQPMPAGPTTASTTITSSTGRGSTSSLPPLQQPLSSNPAYPATPAYPGAAPAYPANPAYPAYPAATVPSYSVPSYGAVIVTAPATTPSSPPPLYAEGSGYVERAGGGGGGGVTSFPSPTDGLPPPGYPAITTPLTAGAVAQPVAVVPPPLYNDVNGGATAVSLPSMLPTMSGGTTVVGMREVRRRGRVLA